MTGVSTLPGSSTVTSTPAGPSSLCSASPRLSTYALAALSWAMFGSPWKAPSAEVSKMPPRHAAEAMRAAVAGDGPEARLRAMVTALAGYLTSRPGTCAGLLGAFGAAGRLGEILQSSDTWVAAPLREALTQGREAGLVAAGDPADAANAILGGLLLAVLGRAMTGADPTDPRFRQHLADQLLRGVVTG
jgi:hypothetical protein